MKSKTLWMNYLKCNDCIESKGDRAGDAPVPHPDNGVSGGSVQSLNGLNGAGEYMQGERRSLEQISESPSPSRLKISFFWYHQF